MKLEGLCNETTARWFYAWYSNYYDSMQKYFSSPEMRERGLDLAEVRAGQEVLDVGAGTGTLTQQVLLRGVQPADMVMLDLSEGMLNKARQKAVLDGVRKVVGDAQDLPFADQTFDRVVSSGSIYYWPDPVRAMREALRVLKPGGRALAVGTLEPNALGIRFLAQTFNRFPTEANYRHWFDAAGFADVRTEHVANPWNEAQFAIAISGTRPEVASVAPTNGDEPVASKKADSLLATLNLGIRFVIAMLAFAIIGPMQVIVAARHFRREKKA